MTGRFGRLFGAFALLFACGSLVGAEKVEITPEATQARLKTDITFLASNDCEGRGPTTAGLDKAADYIANKFKESGLKPAGVEGTYFQPFGIPGMVLDGKATLTLTPADGKPVELKAGEQFQPMAVSGGGTVKDAPVVFAGYGIKSETLKYNDYADLDVRDKVVLVLRNHPKVGQNDAKAWDTTVGSLTAKIQAAEKAGAAAVLIVNDKSTEKDDLVPFNYHAVLRRSAGPSTKIPAFQVSRQVADQLLAKTGTSLADREAAIVKDLKPQSAEIKGFALAGNLPSKAGQIPLKNVVGVLEGKGPLADETIVIGAHYDHLGYAGAGGSLARTTKPVMHNGADDNASGTTAVLELARRFAAQKDRVGRRLVFMTYSGEELGLLGSAHYCKNPIFPLEKTASMVNLDMVGRLPKDEKTGKEKLLVEANTTAKEWEGLLDKWNEKHQFDMKRSKSVMPNSDHYSFYKQGVPAIFFWTGTHPDYHRPTDTAEKINLAGMRRIVDLSDDVIAYLASTSTPPTYQKTAVGGGGGRMPLGLQVGQTTKEGVLVEGAFKDSPAEKAGLKKGDLIVEVAGKPVKNSDAFSTVMADQQPGKEIDLVIIREEKRQTIKVTPAAPMTLPRLGLRPTTDEEKGAVLVDSVSEGGPADKAGLKKGDLIVELAGKPVKSVETYMAVMATQKPGDELEVTILRDNKRQTVKVKPE